MFFDMKKYCVLLTILLFGVSLAFSQEKHTEICVDFRVNSTVIDSKFSDNATRVQEIIDFLNNIRSDSTINIVEIAFCGAVSPEGSDQLNRKLARGRLNALESIIREQVDIPDSIIKRDDNHIPWDYLKDQIESSNLSHKEEVIAILNEKPRLVKYDYPNTHVDNRIVKLKQLDNGRVWQQMHKLFFEKMRNASVVFVTYKQEIPPMPKPEPVVVPVDTVHEVCETPVIVPTSMLVDEWTRKLHIKTNALGWALGITNIGAEIDLAKHWSFALPVYYSAWNYFKYSLKFRTLAVQPEFRFWFNENNRNFFIGAHFGYAQYNLAVDGDYRFQDHDGKSPALGGGISIGYRLPISKNNRWHIEFTLGAGVYDLHYDKFYNVENGKLTDTRRKTYFGIDNAAVNISYSFDLKKRKK